MKRLTAGQLTEMIQDLPVDTPVMFDVDTGRAFVEDVYVRDVFHLPTVGQFHVFLSGEHSYPKDEP